MHMTLGGVQLLQCDQEPTAARNIMVGEAENMGFEMEEILLDQFESNKMWLKPDTISGAGVLDIWNLQDLGG